MHSRFVAIVLPQIDKLIDRCEAVRKKCEFASCSDAPSDVAIEIVASGTAAIHRAAGMNSQYAIHLAEVQRRHKNDPVMIPFLLGVLRALRNDIQAGYLDSVEELIHANLFADFVEMAQHLLDEGYKDAAAVIVGGVLEGHIRKLCDKNSIPTEFTDSKGDVRSKSVDKMNSELAAANVYSKLDQKNVTAWYDLRTKAAHGHYAEYTKEQVEPTLAAIRDFLTRHPA